MKDIKDREYIKRKYEKYENQGELYKNSHVKSRIIREKKKKNAEKHEMNTGTQQNKSGQAERKASVRQETKESSFKNTYAEESNGNSIQTGHVSGAASKVHGAVKAADAVYTGAEKAAGMAGAAAGSDDSGNEKHLRLAEKAAGALRKFIEGAAALALTIAAGGWAVLIVVIVIAVITMILFSSFGIFFSMEASPEDNIGVAIQQIAEDYKVETENRISEAARQSGAEVIDFAGIHDGDSFTVNNMTDILAVYAVMVSTDSENPQDVLFMTDEKREKLKQIFSDMNSISVKSVMKEEKHTDELTGVEIVETVPHIVVSYKYMNFREAAVKYNFDKSQRELVEEMMSPAYRSYYAGICGVDILGGTDLTRIVSGLDVSSRGSEIVRAALEKLGCPYVWGSKGENSFDCSGLVYWAISRVDRNLGKEFYTNASYQAKYCYDRGLMVGESELMPGDLIFWQNASCHGCGRWNEIHHVGIYAGDGKVVEASSSKGHVVVRDMWSSSSYPVIMFARLY